MKESLGVPVLYAGRNRMDYIIEVESEEIVRGLKPDEDRKIHKIHCPDAKGTVWEVKRIEE